jgi:hypothetical protein
MDYEDFVVILNTYIFRFSGPTYWMELEHAMEFTRLGNATSY